MAFDQSSISQVRVKQDAADLLISWSSTAPDGTTFQVYLNRRLAWTGRGRRCTLPVPATPGNHSVDVGTVAAGESRTDFGASLTTVVGDNRPKLSWNGGRYLDPDLDRFEIYRSAVAGGAVDYSKPVGTVPAYPGGIPTDGYGMGGYGSGGYGSGAGTYTWTGPPLGAGSWTFAVVGVDKAGNRSTSPPTVTLTVASAPRAPAPNSMGKRLTVTYSIGTNKATLSWLAPPV